MGRRNWRKRPLLKPRRQMKACHDLVTDFVQFHRDEVDLDTAAALFPRMDLATPSFLEMVDFLQLKGFGSCVDGEDERQDFLPALSFSPEITDELMFGDCRHIYFCRAKEVLVARRFDRIWLILQCY